jgi:hypothetical protein
MPTPKIYHNIAVKYHKHRWYFLVVAVVGVFFCLFSILLSTYLSVLDNPFPLFAVGLLIMIWGWGIFMVNNWYGDKAVERKKRLLSRFRNERLLSVLFVFTEWGASFFLNVWFVASTIFIVMFLIHSVGEA